MVRTHATVILGLLTWAMSPVLGAQSEKEPALWFPVGEELVYRVKWGIIPVGTSTIKSEWIESNGKRLLVIRYRTLTNAVFSRIYPMNDFAESIIDPETFLPKTFTFVRAKRREARSDTVTFDYDKGTALVVHHCSGKRETVPIQPDTRDIITFMFWMREKGIPTSHNKTYQVMTNEGIVPITVRSDAKTKKVKVPGFGKVECLHVEPSADFKDMLVEEGEISMWIAQDARRIAPMLAIKAPLAKVKTTLCSVLGPGDDLWTKASGENGEDAASEPPEHQDPPKLDLPDTDCE